MSKADLESSTKTLPVGSALPELGQALTHGRAAVLEAPPGAGKTTLVPLALLDAPWLANNRIVMLEPRRLAARAAARRMAFLLGEDAGETVGYRTRLDTRIGPKTRIEVVTEGILLRLLQQDAALDGIGLVVFDEFHERSLDADLGLALALETQRYLREDLRLLVMSATLDGAPVAELLGGAPIVKSTGRSFAVEIRALDRPSLEQLEKAVARAILTALDGESGSLLVFLPGGREIRRVARLLETGDLPTDVQIAPLYGDLPQPAQDAAIAPAPKGKRKVVLATSIAETSLTIEGIRIVIDSGYVRTPQFEPRSGMTRLITERVSQAASEQRRGRAGRLEPGLCYRLWPAAEQATLKPFATPEILAADLSPLALALAQWGTATDALSWLDPPPEAAYTGARTLLRRLRALDQENKITAHGRAMAALGVHPRLAHMMLAARSRGQGKLAAIIAALLEERDILRSSPGGSTADLAIRVEAVSGHAHDPAIDRKAAERVREQARRYHRQSEADREFDLQETGRLLAQAYPDRLAQRRDQAGRFRLSNGRGAELPPQDSLAGEEFIAIADLDGDRRSARIFLAAPIARSALLQDFADEIETVASIAWDPRDEAVLARRRRMLGALVLSDEALADPPAEGVTAALLAGIRSLGLAALPWHRDAENLRHRIGFVRGLKNAGEEWPDVSDEGLLGALEHWLAPQLPGITRRAQWSSLDLASALRQWLSFEQQRALDRLAPTHWTVPSGSRLPIDYAAADVPVLAVRLQEMFGARETPAVGGNRVPLLLHLLSPAGRPLQVTRDIDRFWDSSYPEVRRDMRGRYPKHPWPEDPRNAPPTARSKRAASPRESTG